MLLIKSESRHECSSFVLNSISYIQMRRSYLGLTSIIEENNDQTEKVQFTFVVRIISRELYILQPNWIKKVKSQQKVSRFVETNKVSYTGLPRIRITKLITVPELLFSTYIETLLSMQRRDAFVIQKKWKYSLDNNDVANRNVVTNEKLN